MKRVLITGANSYVGSNVEKWLTREPDKYHVETLDMKNPSWINYDFSKFDVVFHVAGIAHISTKKSMKELYFKVNRDLAVQTASISKKSGVKQFIFMSSMIVYNSKEKCIMKSTKPNPDNFYGMSKLQAEKEILKLSQQGFDVTILRPSVIYGNNSKGNFSLLSSWAKRFKIFPFFQNKKSVLYIDNLCKYVCEVIQNCVTGIFCVSNLEYISTYQIVKKMADVHHSRITLVRFFNPLIRISLNINSKMNKIFGDQYYHHSILSHLDNLGFMEFDKSIEHMFERR